MSGEGAVRIATAAADDLPSAARAILSSLQPSSLAGALVFCPNRSALDSIAAEAANQRLDLPILGCTTAGEITPAGPASGTITAIGLPSVDFALQAVCFADLDNFDPFAAHPVVTALVADVSARATRLGPVVEKAGLLLIDGLSRREEFVAHALQHILADIALVGGSAGDGRSFGQTWLLHEGVVRSDCAILAVLAARRPLKPFRSHYHAPGATLAVVTAADAAARTVFALNGAQAAAEYARLIGVHEQDLSEETLAQHPLMVRVGGEYFCRAVQRIGGNGSLIFHSAIERGLVLRLGSSADPLSNLIDSLDACDELGAGFDAVLAFECAANRLEAARAGLTPALSALYARHRFVGFNTYGEQFREFHVNRNLVGLAIGRSRLC